MSKRFSTLYEAILSSVGKREHENKKRSKRERIKVGLL
jgi:hypothetical protein